MKEICQRETYEVCSESITLMSMGAVTDGHSSGANGHLARPFFKSSFSLRVAKTGPMVAEFAYVNSAFPR